jgi:hypothetical protein
MGAGASQNIPGTERNVVHGFRAFDLCIKDGFPAAGMCPNEITDYDLIDAFGPG